MDRLVRILILSACILHTCVSQEKVKRSIFSWSKETEVKDQPVVPGYLPPVTIHKYQGVQINPVNGPPVYLPSDAPASDGVSVNQFQSAQLPPEYSSQLELLKSVAPYLPDEGGLQDYDVTALLPYVDLISEDALARIQFAIESEKSPKESKLLKLIAFLKFLKELKLKPFKVAANFGATLLKKKKQTVSNLLHLGKSPSTTVAPVVYPPGGYPIYPPRPPQYPLYDESQPLEQPQPIAQPILVSDNRLDSTFGRQQIPAYPPTATFLTYPQYSQAVPQAAPQAASPVAPPRRNFVESETYFSYPDQFHSPSSYQPLYQYPSNAESTPAPYQQPPTMHLEEPHPSKSSNVPTYQATEQPVNFHNHHFASQEKSQKYHSTPASTYASGELAGSASDNIEKIKENSGPVVSSETSVKKEEHSLAKAENHHTESPLKPKITKLRLIESRPPVAVYPETSESKSTGKRKIF